MTEDILYYKYSDIYRRGHARGAAMNRPHKAIYIIPAVMMAAAVLPMPYGYYLFLRLVAVVAAGWIAMYLWSADKPAWSIMMGCLALLYNPLIRISFDREVWAPLNIITAIMFLAALLFSGNSDDA